MKNVVLCFDGTGNEFGDANTNVVKLYATLDLTSPEQIAYYHPGLGTMGAPNALGKLRKWWTRQLGLAFGYGISRTIANGYAFIMENFEKDDRLFLFGFSRGAYIARALASMLRMVGLLRAGDNELIAYAARFLKRPEGRTWKLAAHFKGTFSRECKPHFVGVWDTVSSVGWIYDAVKFPYTAVNPDVAIGRHALSIDERRCFFRQNMWGEAGPAQNAKQAWFPGVHEDVGGGYPERESGLAKVSLEWMIREASAAGLRIDSEKRDRILGRSDGSFVAPDPLGLLHHSLKGLWWLLEFWPRRFYDTRFSPPAWRWKLPLAAARWIPEGSTLHRTVLTRLAGQAYKPANLPQEYVVED